MGGHLPHWLLLGFAPSLSLTLSLPLGQNYSGRSLRIQFPIPHAWRTSKSNTQATRPTEREDHCLLSAWTRPVHPASATQTLTAANSKRMAPRVQTILRNSHHVTQTWGQQMPRIQTHHCRNDEASVGKAEGSFMQVLQSQKTSPSTEVTVEPEKAASDQMPPVCQPSPTSKQTLVMTMTFLGH